jgi:hypothetical protein
MICRDVNLTPYGNLKMPSATVHVVHCIDTEGPLDETLEALFERVNNAFGLSVEPSEQALKELQKKRHASVSDKQIAAEVALMVDPKLRRYLSSWGQIEEMLDEVLAEEFRQRFADSFGQGWIYNWFCVDHVGFTSNPRNRTLGFHKVFDWYQSILSRTGSIMDGLHFHHHPVPFSLEAHHSGTNYLSFKPTIFEILCRRLIDRRWFPEAYRPGFHTIRPDSHWFLEQYIPFDYSNQAKRTGRQEGQHDLANGRFGDWRRAPVNWTPYHPHHDDYQRPGKCRRWIARCLNVGTRTRLLEESEVDAAFREAESGFPVVLAFANHDYRDIRSDIGAVWTMLKRVSARYPRVNFRYSNAADAMRSALELTDTHNKDIDIKRFEKTLIVESGRSIFGPQPFLAIKTKSGEYFHDNLDVQTPNRRWTYVLDESTIPMKMVEEVAVGSNGLAGNPAVASWRPDSS